MEGVIRDAGDTMLPGLGASVNQVVGSTLDSFKNLSNSTDLIYGNEETIWTSNDGTRLS